MRLEDYPETMGLDPRTTNRGFRFVELSAAHPVISRDVFLNIKFDTQYSIKSELVGLVREVLAYDWSAEPNYAAAAEHLVGWNNRMDVENTHAAIAGMMVTRKILLDREAANYTALDLFRWSVDYLTRNFGRIDPNWGKVNRLVRGDVNLPVDGGPDTLRAIYAFEFLDGGQIKAVAGDTWIGIAEWDENGHLNADIIHQFGSATMDASSPHYADQAPLFVAEKWRKAMLTRTEVEARPHTTYRPGEE
jgi:penicillin amidase/acyl-homoserine-lactone acylase